MKKFLIIAGIITAGVALVSCGDSKRSPGRAYMPDMAYSNAYETYATAQERLDHSNVEGTKPTYNNRPVIGTMARGDLAPYAYKNDSAGYVLSASVKSPLETAAIDMKEAERLYLVNCAICHGSKLDGNGPLFKGGEGPYTAAPKNFMSEEAKALSEGTMFHSVTYGKGQMGSYASQLNTKQRWMVIAYIRGQQSKPTAPAAGGSTDSTVKASTAATPDSTGKTK